MTQVDRWIAVHTGAPHYLDHLGVLCELLSIPLWISDLSTFQAAQQFYPDLRAVYYDLSELSLELMVMHADVIFESGHRFAVEMIPSWEMLFQKKMRMVYCPHGNSDKGFQTKHHFPKDIYLIYGQHMYNHLLATEELRNIQSTVLTGNYRLLYYQKKKDYYDALLRQVTEGKLVLGRPSILYAPTWPDGENNSSFFSQGERVIKELSKEFNLLIRWHPLIDEIDPAAAEKMRALCEETEGVCDLTSFPVIYPVIHLADAYVGDFSSIGYDFLSVQKPLFFLETHHGEIYSCGKKLASKESWVKVIGEWNDTDEWKEKRAKLYEKVFGQPRSTDAMIADLEKALRKPRPSWLSQSLDRFIL